MIRDHNIAFRHFLKGELDTFEMILPNWWHEKAVTPEYKQGYVQKVMAMTDTKQGAGVHLNVANPKLADLNVRLGIQHAFNIDKMIETVLHGDYDRATTFGSGFGPSPTSRCQSGPTTSPRHGSTSPRAATASRGPDGILQNDKGERLTWGPHLHQPGALQAADRAQGRGQEGGPGSGAQSGGWRHRLQGDAGEETRGGLAWLGAAVSIRNTGSPSTPTTPTKPQTNNLFNVADKELDSLIDAYNVEFDMDKRAALPTRSSSASMISPSSCPGSAQLREPAAGAM